MSTISERPSVSRCCSPPPEHARGLAFVRRWGCPGRAGTRMPWAPAPCPLRVLLSCLGPLWCGAVTDRRWGPRRGKPAGLLPFALPLFSCSGVSPPSPPPRWSGVVALAGGLHLRVLEEKSGLARAALRPSGAGRAQRVAAELSRATVEWESGQLCAGLGAAAPNGFDGAVVVCCLENLHSASCPRGASAPQTVART